MKIKYDHLNSKTDSPGLLKPIAIGNTLLPGNLFLAPLAGYSEAAFRSVCLENGADFTYTEMVSAEALARNNKKTIELLRPAENEALLGVQVFGPEYKTFLRALPRILTFGPTLIDINCGCSVPKVLKTGSGAMLLQHPQKIHDIIKALVQAAPIPVTLKIRSGWDESSINFLEIAAVAGDAGASLITLHPRTRAGRFFGNADWEQIKKLKAECPLPVIGSGDLFSADDALRMLSETSCDGVMFARGAIGNPFIFARTKHYITHPGEEFTISPAQKLEVFLMQLEHLARIKGEQTACREMRKQLAAYTKGMKNAKPLREACNKAETMTRYRRYITAYLESLGEQSGPVRNI